MDSAGNAYVTGTTSSYDFPIVNELQSSLGGLGGDAFVAKLDAPGALVYSTYLCGIDCGDWYTNCPAKMVLLISPAGVHERYLE